MSIESTQELRDRLLRNPEIQKMIRNRAFEIYERSGRVNGHDAENWFQAEYEVISFLVEEEQRRAEEARQPVPPPPVSSDGKDDASREILLTTEEQASTQSTPGTWSATEPASLELAPQIGQASGAQVDTPKKRATRSTSKSPATKAATPRKKKATEPEAKVVKKEASAKKTTRSTSSKKAGEPAKAKATRKQPKQEE